MGERHERSLSGVLTESAIRNAGWGMVGAGGEAVAYKYWDAASARFIVLKLYRDPSGPELPHQLQQARRLVALQLQASDASACHVVRHLGYGGLGGRLCLAMELLTGSTLRDVLRERERLDWRLACRVAAQAALGVQWLHTQFGRPHGDLKPENLFVTRDGPVKVLDVAVSRPAARALAAPANANDVPFSAPYRDPWGESGFGSDVYSLGAILYECLTGRVLVPDHGLRARTGSFVPFHWGAETPHHVATICRSTFFAPAHRPTPGDLAARLAEAATERNPSFPEGASPPNPALVSRRRVLAAGVAAAGGTALAAAFWNVRRPERSADRAAAEAVVRLGGTVTVRGPDGTSVPVGTSDALPRYPFRVTEIGLSGNPRVTDALLAPLGSCTELATLRLDRTPVTDTGLRHFAACTNLTDLDLFGTSGVTDAGLAAFRGCAAVRYLQLGGTGVSGAGLAHFGNCKQLKWVGFQSTGVTDAALAMFRDCEGLESADLRDTALTGAGLAHFLRCRKLRKIEIVGTFVDEHARRRFESELPGCRVV